MNWWKLGTRQVIAHDVATSDRRKDPRIGGHFTVRYSGESDHKLIMGEATIVDVSRYGFGLTGDRGLKLGMELTLFLEMSCSDDDLGESLCIPHAYVAWTDGRRFGVTIRSKGEKAPVWVGHLSEFI